MDINDCLKALDDGTQIVTTTFGWLEKWQEQSYSQGFNAAVDKAVEIVNKANNFMLATNQDEIWNSACRQADGKLRAVIEELKKLKEV